MTPRGFGMVILAFLFFSFSLSFCKSDIPGEAQMQELMEKYSRIEIGYLPASEILDKEMRKF